MKLHIHIMGAEYGDGDPPSHKSIKLTENDAKGNFQGSLLGCYWVGLQWLTAQLKQSI